MKPGRHITVKWFRDPKVVLPLLVLLTIFLRLPTMADVNCDPDLAGMCYSGTGLLDGYLPYRDSTESKPPGAFFLVAAATAIGGRNFVAIHALAILFHIVSLLLIYLIAKRIWQSEIGLLAGYFYATYSVLERILGLCPNYETWALPFLLGALLCSIEAAENDSNTDVIFAAGALSSLAMQVKFQAVFVVFALFVGLMITRRKSVATALRTLIFFAIGGVVAVVPLVVFFAVKGGLSDMLHAFSPVRSVEYAEENRFVLFADFLPDVARGFFGHAPMLITSAAIGFAIVVYEIGARHSKRRNGEILFLLFSVASVAMVFFFKGLFSAGHFAYHYYLFLVPSLALFAGRFVIFIVSKIPDRTRLVVVLVVVGAVIARFMPYVAWGEGAAVSLAYEKTAAPIFAQYDRLTKMDHEILGPLGDYLKRNTDSEDTIFVWDYIPAVYCHAERRAPSRHYKYWQVVTTDEWGHFFDNEHPVVKREREALMADLSEHPPKYIVAYRYPFDIRRPTPTEKQPFFPTLAEFVHQHYKRIPMLPWEAVDVYRLDEN